MRSSERAWIVLGVGILGYEVLAKEGELLSEQIDRWLERHRFFTTAAVMITAAHLLNWLPKRVDPFHLVFSGRGRGG